MYLSRKNEPLTPEKSWVILERIIWPNSPLFEENILLYNTHHGLYAIFLFELQLRRRLEYVLYVGDRRFQRIGLHIRVAWSLTRLAGNGVDPWDRPRLPTVFIRLSKPVMEDVHMIKCCWLVLMQENLFHVTFIKKLFQD